MFIFMPGPVFWLLSLLLSPDSGCEGMHLEEESAERAARTYSRPTCSNDAEIWVLSCLHCLQSKRQRNRNIDSFVDIQNMSVGNHFRKWCLCRHGLVSKPVWKKHGGGTGNTSMQTCDRLKPITHPLITSSATSHQYYLLSECLPPPWCFLRRHFDWWSSGWKPSSGTSLLHCVHAHSWSNQIEKAPRRHRRSWAGRQSSRISERSWNYIRRVSDSKGCQKGLVKVANRIQAAVKSFKLHRQEAPNSVGGLGSQCRRYKQR